MAEEANSSCEQIVQDGGEAADPIAATELRLSALGGEGRPAFPQALGRGELGADAREYAGQRGAGILDGRNDRERNAGGNQPIFDGRSAAFIREKLPERGQHLNLP